LLQGRWSCREAFRPCAAINAFAVIQATNSFLSHLFPLFLGAENPTYLKEPSDKIIFGIMCFGAVLGSMQVLGGLYSMSLGVNKLK
jgi:hypothetical protein